VAMDFDADALVNARENIARNRAAADVEIVQADLSSFSVPPADIVTANLTASVLSRHAARLRQLVKPGGTLIVSGFSPDELPRVLSSLGAAEVSDRAVENDWAAASLVI
jgi:ribosomal protein L11 methyltransferase